MCSEYTVKTKPREIEDVLGASVIDHAEAFEWGKTVKFFTQAPVIQKSGNHYELKLRTFPTSPFPNARLSGLEGQSDSGSDNDDVDEIQIKRIYDMKLWKKGFTDDPVLIPMTEFTEFAYWGPNIGTAQGFKIPDEKVMFAAGIGLKPYTPKGEQGDGHAMLTHTATEEMLETHHRLIVLLPAKVALEYLDEMNAIERFDYLIKNRYKGPLNENKVRNMGKGWEKRIENQERKLQNELRYREVLKKVGVEGYIFLL
jgi:putative SOS response-associated peptidase YedK